MKRRLFLATTAAVALVPRTALGSADSGVFARPESAGASNAPQRVYFHRPANWHFSGRVVMVMHGVQRDADRYRDEWAPLADRHGFLLVCPEFSNEKFPRSAWYNFGGLRQTDDPRLRAFAVPDRVFDDVRRRFGATAARYSLYGHSAGAQFVHRFALLAPSAAVDQAIAANAGWYTLPVFDQPFPYGLQGTLVNDDQVAAFLRRPLVLQLGDADIDPAHPSLRRNADADRQGLHRFARGMNYLEAGRREAARRAIALAWRVVTVPGVAHDNAGMARSAAALLFS